MSYILNIVLKIGFYLFIYLFIDFPYEHIKNAGIIRVLDSVKWIKIF